MSKNSKMNQAAAARIQSAAARQNGGKVEAGSFAARAQSVASRVVSASDSPNWPSKQDGQPSGGGRDNNPPRTR
ncbi:hypothetical protein [Halopseudomonas pelagia]|uniref:hypothetical protein n=1 Tax=Halopseudomonas pelagia TaxID=553151 RepID=UPI0030D79EE3|tara:strand:+ start:2891 stop:3112 length:222 start_codon:yes stop_codon:yes gene_type:complete